MKNNLVPVIKDFIKKENIDFSVAQYKPYEFWLDDLDSSITVRFKISLPDHQILYDVYSPNYNVRLKEESIKDVEKLESLAEENREWKIAESIEGIWLVLDQIRLWANYNNFNVKQKQLI